MPGTRDDFSTRTKRALAKRASYICSNLDCRVHTLAPSEEDEEKFLYIGKAAHITAATEGGPRFDPSFSSEDRQSIKNGIFLCSNCADMIDKNDGVDFPTELLRKWKEDHESWVRDNLNKNPPRPKDDGLTINVKSYHQKGGITAGVVNVGSQPRLLNDRLKAKLLEVLKHKGREVTLTCALGDGEAFNFATQIMEYLSSQGYVVKGVNQAVWTKPIRGQTIDPETYEIRVGTKE